MENCSIAIIDDHKIVREGLKSMLMENHSIQVIAEGANGDDLLEILKVQTPTLIIMDISMPGKSGIELTEYLTAHHPQIKVLILTTNSDEESIIAAIEAGANGFLHKDCSVKELFNAIELISAGEGYFSENITGIIYKSYINRIQYDNNYKQTNQKTLSEREVEIIKLFAEGLSYKEIANQLNLSTKTIESHKNNILQKLELSTTIDLVKYAIKNKIIRL